MKNKQRREFGIFRYIDRSSFVHDIWAGTKIVILTLVSIAVTSFVNWPTLCVMTGFVLIVFIFAKVPIRAIPVPPAWIVVLVLISGIVTGIEAGGKPYVHFGRVVVKLGGVETFFEFALFSLDIIFLLMIVGWTSKLGEVSSSLARILKPLKKVGLPIDEVVATLSLSIRAVPLVIDEIKTISLVEKQRRKHRPAFEDAKRVKDVFNEGIDMIIVAITSCLRRATEIGEAIEARGGYSDVVGLSKKLSRKDVFALFFTLLVITTMGVFYLVRI